jgi:hypothetical protein
MADEKTPLDDYGSIKASLLWLAGRMRTDGGFLSLMPGFAPKVEAAVASVDALDPATAASLRATLDAYRVSHPKVDQSSLLKLYQGLPKGLVKG